MLLTLYERLEKVAQKELGVWLHRVQQLRSRRVLSSRCGSGWYPEIFLMSMLRRAADSPFISKGDRQDVAFTDMITPLMGVFSLALLIPSIAMQVQSTTLCRACFLKEW